MSSFFIEREVGERAARGDRGAVKAVEVPRQRDVAARTREDFIIMDGLLTEAVDTDYGIMTNE